ncbi:MAG: response regulator transcription factor [Oscillibacter sp.]|nr:response regulator transcription factor [Oscillibacter sp.]
MKILLIEDDPALREILQHSLQQERYVVELAPDYHTASQKTHDYTYDCILLDIMLPDGNGLSLLKELQESKKQGNVIIISAKDSLDDKVNGLDLGADDYLPKPFHLAELHARIKSVIRRKNRDGNIFTEYGNIKVNTDTFDVYVEGKVIELNRKEYDILLYFLNRPERLLNKNTLAEAVWGDHIDQTDNFDFIYAQIKNLRKKLMAAGATPEIKAVYGFGYKITLK